MKTKLQFKTFKDLLLYTFLAYHFCIKWCAKCVMYCKYTQNK